MSAQLEAAAARQKIILAVLGLGAIAYVLLQSLVVPALPTMQRDLGASTSGAAWIFTAFLIAAAVATPIAGRLGDMFGKKRVMILVLAVTDFGGFFRKSRREGDSTLSVFTRASDAARAIATARRALHAVEWPTREPLAVRMVLHTGETLEREGDYYGRTVNRAARTHRVCGSADADSAAVRPA